MLLRTVSFVTGGICLAALAVAAGDIPTRYSGAFPSTANVTGISGTFTGNALTLRGTSRKGGQLAGRYSCTNISAKQTRCNGTLKAVAGSYSDNHTVTITWAGGQPVAMSGNH